MPKGIKDSGLNSCSYQKSVMKEKLMPRGVSDKMSMERFTGTEPADMHLIYGLAKGNARAAEGLDRERYP
ncbi:hypothetical protein TNCV_2393981 [Trichonephila clavipes]|nr:hypothetical protein TNCV_2393981 [Trichonephila clavipes]